MVLAPAERFLELDRQIGIHAGRSRLSEYRLAVLLAEVFENRFHGQLGYASLGDYAADRHDIERGKANALRRIGERLHELPQLDARMSEGKLCWTRARAVASIATPESEGAWLAYAEDHSRTVLERAVKIARHTEDQLPPDDAVMEDPNGTVRLVFEVTKSEAEQIRTVLTLLRAACGDAARVDDGQLLATLARTAMAQMDPEISPNPERVSHVIVNHPPAEAAAVPEHPALSSGEACCDAEVVEMDPEGQRGRSSHTIPPTTRRAVLHRDQLRCRIPGCSNRLWLHVHHVVPWGTAGSSHREGNLLSLCNVHHRLVHEGRIEIRPVGSGFRVACPDGRTWFVDVGLPGERGRRGGPAADAGQLRDATRNRDAAVPRPRLP